MKKRGPVTVSNETPRAHRDDSKKGRILAELKHPKGVNRFEAERIGDHCLNTTIAVLRREGFNIYDEWEIVPTRFNPRGVRVKRYRCLGRMQ